MTAVTLLLVISSAVLHATWNLLAKESHNKLVFFCGMLVSSVVLSLPVFIYLFLRLGIPGPGWYCLALTGTFNAAYFFCLGRAYEEGELSLVYPLARGSAPIIIPFLARLFLGEKISPLGGAGILVICVGIYVLHLKSLSLKDLSEPFGALRNRSSRFALATGLCTALYSVVDKRGVSLVHPFLYIYMMFSLSASWLTLLTLGLEREALVLQWHQHKLGMVVAGTLCMLAYLPILVALTISKVSYVAAARSINIVLGTALGSILLREAYGQIRLTGASLIFLGILLVALAN